MLVETDAIILHTIKYSETSIIAHVFTEEFGNGTYIMNNVRTNRSKMALFQPLSLVRISAYRKKDPKQIHRISNISFIQVPTSVTNNIVKSSISMFAGEIVNRIFTEEEYSTSIFSFLKSFVVLLENSQENYANLHILFLLHLTKFLGVFPQNNYSLSRRYFSLTLGEFVETESDGTVLMEKNSLLFLKILNTRNIDESISLTQQERQSLLSALLLYYDIHICKTQNIKSFEILKMVFE
ncbi:MAG: DNA repair protein RecO [Bacteroidales bacterium]|nr:DNA repair protein RecO [Bacteroidales bacterium]